jgi:hypothetical protein
MQISRTTPGSLWRPASDTYREGSEMQTNNDPVSKGSKCLSDVFTSYTTQRYFHVNIFYKMQGAVTNLKFGYISIR